jgi:hypothetical protein
VSIEQGAPIKNPPNNEEEMYKFYEASDIEDYVSFSENDNLLPLYIECLPDSGSTSHVFHQHDMFTDYRSTDNITVGGVGGNRTRVHGKGSVKLIAEHDNRRCAITLQDVLHVP